MQFKDIPQFTRFANYRVNTSWKFLETQLDSWNREEQNCPLILDPDFQREHVWTKKQQERYIEFILRGGTSSRDIYWNCAGWMGNYKGPMYLVDGKQRLQAARLFMANKLKVFGNYMKDFEGNFPLIQYDFVFHVNNLETKAEVIQWYLDLNFGGTPHTTAERKRVEDLLKITHE